MKVDILKIAVAISTFALIVGVEAVADTSKDMFRLMKSGGHVLMLRHAYAPGTGDPENFRIGDCSTQRNLDAQGRSQAIGIEKPYKKREYDLQGFSPANGAAVLKQPKPLTWDRSTNCRR